VSAVTQDSQNKAATTVVLATTVVKSWKTPIALAVFAIIAATRPTNGWLVMDATIAATKAPASS
jgi:hypothetical protein